MKPHRGETVVATCKRHSAPRSSWYQQHKRDCYSLANLLASQHRPFEDSFFIISTVFALAFRTLYSCLVWGYLSEEFELNRLRYRRGLFHSFKEEYVFELFFRDSYDAYFPFLRQEVFHPVDVYFCVFA